MSSVAEVGVGSYPLLMDQKVKDRARRGSRISSKNQLTIPVEALGGAGLRAGDRLRVEVRGPGELLLVREADPIEGYAGSLTGLYGPGYLDELRDEWA
jgi:bifunctional DNA-binding transcriptional regulator/antitoxin component of YhaV-PrlF toxin-antitoxin module